MKTIIITFVSLSIAFASAVQGEDNSQTAEINSIMNYNQQNDVEYLQKLSVEQKDNAMMDLDAI